MMQGWSRALAAALAVALGTPAAAGPPSLDGIWTNAYLTTMERRKELKSLTLTEAEARAFEQHPPPVQDKDPLGQETSEFGERGSELARIRGQARTSWITAPADGKIPYRADAAARNKAVGAGYDVNFDTVEQRPLSERCLGSASAGPPLRNGADSANFMIVQTADHVAIWAEYLGNLRIVRIGAKHSGVRRWMGESIGWWEGSTLVVETENFYAIPQPGEPDTGGRRVTERFTRTGPAELHYAFKVEDPAIYSQSWQGEMILRPRSAIYEYACHEGNYGVTNALLGGRAADAATAAGAPADKTLTAAK